MGEELLKFWRWLQNTAQQAAIAEAPAVMTAAGHKINRTTKKVEYNHQNDKGVKQLRANLSAIGEAAATAPGAAEAVELGYNIVRHPQQSYRAAKGLVQYAKNKLAPRKNNANWQGDAVQLTKDRLANGGFERLQSAHNENVVNPSEVNLQTTNPLFIKNQELPLIYSPEKKAELLATNVNEVPSWYATGNPNHIGVSNSELGPVLYSDRPVQYLGRQAGSDIAAHEFSHYVYTPSDPIPREFFTPVEGYGRYFTKNRSAEVAARGTQLKNYFGLKEGEPLTVEHLKYAAKHFVKDRGYDNGMTQFFQSIKNWDKTAKWLTKNAPGYVAGGYIGNTLLNTYDQ